MIKINYVNKFYIYRNQKIINIINNYIFYKYYKKYNV